MATQGPLYPGTVTTLSTGTESANDWLTPGNLSADDAAEAQITAPTFDSPDISFQLIAANFGFTIPTAATINGITVEIDRRAFAGAARDFRVQLQDASGTLVGANKATATAWPGTLGTVSYGGVADTWTASPTEAMVNDPDFGVVLSVEATAANTDIGVDFIRVTVTYTASPNATVTATAIAGISSAAAVTVLGTAEVAPGSIAIAASLPAPTIEGTSGGAGSPIGLFLLLHSSGEPPDALATPSTIAGTTSMGAVTVQGSVEVDLADLVLTADFPQPAIQIIPVPQTGRPDGTSAAGTWTDQAGGTTNLWDVLNETVASDADYAKSAVSPTNDELIVTLTALEDPTSSTGHVVRFRYRKT